ncbi:Zinc finger protein [Plakobranchus ocellatus]|uniref:Zinc finger protein n=1 Tax=Plakobranchus ocellatus TaxID=259542 RepID=A0AAV4CDL1_9GAST|nr:Zinc finger protein [Plakobranchus ocellatus]
MQHTDIVVRKGLVEESQLNSERCLLIRINNTALLTKKAEVNLKTPYVCGEVKTLYIPGAICDVIVRNSKGSQKKYQLETGGPTKVIALIRDVVSHDFITKAHLGIGRTKDRVLSNFYWPGMDGDVTRYCRACDVC